ncbi:hypothetical protein SAMN05660293_00699 [Dyadobacter psychrophilus]|uniref:Uncharacterized protein n=1 Tax=Dyadobacter psychrophilus TaxID=651661 RepID=A0A1T5BY00_9BACT|nr:hypothetical protein SAMN05660293_00699 [Dyadobacter psychrophilus]
MRIISFGNQTNPYMLRNHVRMNDPLVKDLYCSCKAGAFGAGFFRWVSQEKNHGCNRIKKATMLIDYRCKRQLSMCRVK